MRWIVICLLLTFGQQASSNWWLTYATVKDATHLEESLHLHAARQEFVPFQLVFEGGQTVENLQISADTDYFDVALYEAFYVHIQHSPPQPIIFSMAQLMLTERVLPDGLRPFEAPLHVPQGEKRAVWVDVYVRAGTPAGDYPLTVEYGDESKTVTVSVYEVDLPQSGGISVIIPVESNWTIPFYSPDNPMDFHREVNQVLLDHSAIPGTFVTVPRWDGQKWDFSGLDEELAALPEGAFYYAPMPFDKWYENYLILQFSGERYESADFDDPQFVGQVQGFLDALALFLKSQGRLEGALAYPADETRWVADEPIHNGPQGYRRLGQWAELIRAAGLRMTASWVTPVPPGPDWVKTQLLTDDSHVHVDIFDASPNLYRQWTSTPGRSVSLYLNEYGDLIDMPGTIHQGLLWHAYGRGVQMIAGYGAMQWVDENYQLIDPWTQTDALFPQVGYGSGALVWPGPHPSIRLKLLREGVEDTRLLDLYAKTVDENQAEVFAACLTLGELANQNPPPDLWERAHGALLAAISDNSAESMMELCFPPPQYEEVMIIGMDAWVVDEVEVLQTIPDLKVTFTGGEIGHYLEDQDWSRWTALDIDVENHDPYYAELNVGLTDIDGTFVMLHNGFVFIGPQRRQTLHLPLVVPREYEGEFDWSRVKYLSLQINTITYQTDGFDRERIYELGPRTLTFDQFRLVR